MISFLHFLLPERDHYESDWVVIMVERAEREEVQGSSPMLCFDF